MKRTSSLLLTIFLSLSMSFHPVFSALASVRPAYSLPLSYAEPSSVFTYPKPASTLPNLFDDENKAAPANADAQAMLSGPEVAAPSALLMELPQARSYTKKMLTRPEGQPALPRL